MTDSAQQLVEICREFDPQFDPQADFGGLDVDELLGLTFGLLYEHGIDDPEAFLREKGVLQ